MSTRTNRLARHLVTAGVGLATTGGAAIAQNQWRMVTWPQPVIQSHLVDYTQGAGIITNPRQLLELGNPNPPTGRVMGIDFDLAGNLYAATTFNDNRVYRVNDFTGDMTLISNLPAAGAEGDLGYNPANGRLYAVSPLFGVTRVIEIDPLNPNPNTNSQVIMSLTGLDDVSGIAFDSAGNGFAVDTHGNTGGVAELFSVDLTNLQLISYGALGTGTGPAMGLDFDGSDVLHMVTISGAMWSINPVLSGSTVSFVDNINISGVGDINAALAWVPVPSPGSVALLSIAGLTLARRRRS
jgi:hypothetical protein